jgi:predicted nucleotidyltransferase
MLKHVTQTENTTMFESQLKAIVHKIVVAFNPIQIILFGSHAYGTPTKNSDVDLLVVMNSEQRPTKRAISISQILQPRPFPIDILVRTPTEIQHRLDIGDYFFQEILEKGQTLYEQQPILAGMD